MRENKHDIPLCPSVFYPDNIRKTKHFEVKHGPITAEELKNLNKDREEVEE